MRVLIGLGGMVAAAMMGCATSALVVPPRGAVGSEQVALVWVGHGECERLENGAWVRRPELDYDFSVEQHRFADHWESVKSMRRRDPAYDGVAGPRVQTYFFQLNFDGDSPQGRVTGRLTSSLGSGTLVTDREFRAAELAFAAEGVSTMAPFDRYRITQQYDYEGGKLTELVELNKGEQPWVRNREVATLFGARSFDGPPTVLPAR